LVRLVSMTALLAGAVLHALTARHLPRLLLKRVEHRRLLVLSWRMLLVVRSN
jgi:hypothetical protein